MKAKKTSKLTINDFDPESIKKMNFSLSLSIVSGDIIYLREDCFHIKPIPHFSYTVGFSEYIGSFVCLL